MSARATMFVRQAASDTPELHLGVERLGLRASTPAVVSSNHIQSVGPGMFRNDTKKTARSPERTVRMRRNIKTVADTDPVPTGAPEPGTPPIPQQQLA